MWERTTNFMKGAISLSRLALGYTSPNPAVGAVIVKYGLVVGMGHTQPPGSWHAEAMALQQAGPKAYGGTMYVTLEPCCHYGRTPPCTEAIISSGIEEVHVAVKDPNPLVNGKGIAALEKAGIKVILGESAEDAYEVNEAYFKYITTRMPFVTAKIAMTLDGKIATRTGDSKWITGEEARKHVHMIRHTADAIMVGVKTVVADDPHLTARLSSGKGGKSKNQPLRVIVDGKCSTPTTAQVFKEPGKTLIATCIEPDPDCIESYAKVGGEVFHVPSQGNASDMVDLRRLLAELGKREVAHLLVEGGGAIIGSLLDEGLIDKLVVFIAPIIVGGANATPAVRGLGVDTVAHAYRMKQVKMKQVGEDLMISGYPVAPAA